MTESEYRAVIYAERAFGMIQVRQHFRQLAADLGLPADCMEPPPKPRKPRWTDDAAWDKDLARAYADARIEHHYRFSLPAFSRPDWINKPGAFLNVT
jgi:hypothetical protein